MMRATGDLSNCRGDFHRSFRRNSYYFARNTLNLIIKKDSLLYLALRWKISRDNWIARRNLILGQEPLVVRSWVKVNQFLLCMLNASLKDAVSAKSINLWGESTVARNNCSQVPTPAELQFDKIYRGSEVHPAKSLTQTKTTPLLQYYS